MNHKKSILVIEDNHDIRVSLRQALEECGYVVFTATNGLDAITLLNSVSPLPELLILDIEMPIMNGTEFLKAQEKNEVIKNIPVILFSANENSMRDLKGFSQVKKPFNLDVMLSEIEACINREKEKVFL